MRLDHIVLLTRRLDDFATQFERLGFLLTPRGEHGASFGTANRCMTFEDHYAEVLGLYADTPGNVPLQGMLRDNAAVSMAAMQSPDVDATYRELLSRGLAPQPPLHSARDMEGTASGAGRVEYGVVLLPPPPEAELPAFFCQQKTPETVFAPRWRRHPNGALRLMAIDVEARDPEAAAAAFASTGATVERSGDRRIVLAEGPQLALVPLGSLGLGKGGVGSGRAARLTVAVTSLETTREALRRGEAPFRETGDGLLAECGAERPCAVLFRSA
jgi:hypothetical protein